MLLFVLSGYDPNGAAERWIDLVKIKATCSASSRCFEARGCESTLPCDAEEAEDATLKRAKDEFFDSCGFIIKPQIEHFRTLFCVIFA